MGGGSSFKDSHGKVELIKKKNGSYFTRNRDYEWYHSSSFWQQIQSNAKNIKQLYIVGGEPFLIEEHWKLLQSIIDKGTANKTIIEYNTNLTIIPKKMLELWKHFKLIKVGVSIDGVAELNDYIRYPSQFKKIENNLEKLKKSCNNVIIWINTTVQSYNMFKLTDLVLWKLNNRSLNLNEDNVINFHALHNPSFLNVKILPPSYKKKVEEKFISFLLGLRQYLDDKSFSAESSKKIIFSLDKTLKSYILYMNSEDWSHLIPKFWAYSKKLDQIRAQKMQESVPELFESISSWMKDHQRQSV